jgi:hypothetical protein
MKNNSDMHPEDLIYNVRIFIKELAKVQDERFESLVDALKLNKKGEKWLWDYIFNSDEDTEESFEEYLGRYGLTYKRVASMRPSAERSSEKNINRNATGVYGVTGAMGISGSNPAKDKVMEKVFKDLLYQNSGWKAYHEKQCC